MQDVQQAIGQAVKSIFNVEVEIEVTRPDAEFGDWATNVALKLAQQLGKNPRDVAMQLAQNLNQNKPNWLSEITVAGPGFINFKLCDQVLLDEIDKITTKKDKYGKQTDFDGQNVIIEYLDPNLLKEIHIGHAYSGTMGDCLASLFEAAGAKVHRVTYQGDVGLHVGKAIYGILQRINHDLAQLERVDNKPQVLG